VSRSLVISALGEAQHSLEILGIGKYAMGV